MPTRITGLKGYLAEAIVEQWLRFKYPSPQFEIVSQIIPDGVPKTGGAYLDFGVIHNGVVKEVYEVKGQDFIFGKDDKVNKALTFMWANNGRVPSFDTQSGMSFEGTSDTVGFLILLAPPNSDWIQQVSEKNLRFVKLFQDVWQEIDNSNEAEFIAAIRQDLEADIREVVSILKRPKNGSTLLAPFLKKRRNVIGNDGSI